MYGKCDGLQRLGREHWPELYRLMVARGFPDVPQTYTEAKPYFTASQVYGLMDGSELAAGFVFGEPQDGIAFFDVVCRTDFQGQWATIPVLKWLFKVAFAELGLRCVWVQPAHKKALRAALKAGFIPVTPLDGETVILAMTPHMLPKRLQFS